MEQNPSDDCSFSNSQKFPVFYKTPTFLTYLLQSTCSPFSEPDKSFACPSILFPYDPVYDYPPIRR